MCACVHPKHRQHLVLWIALLCWFIIPLIFPLSCFGLVFFSRCFCSGMNGIFSIRQREYKLHRDQYMCTWTEIHSRVLPYFTWLQSPCSFSSVLLSFRCFVVQCSVNAQQDVVVFVVHVLIFALPSILGAYHESNHSEYDHIYRMKYWIIYKWRHEIYIDPMMEIESIRFEVWNWILLSRLVLRFLHRKIW